MSAYVVDKTHIDALIMAALTPRHSYTFRYVVPNANPFRMQEVEWGESADAAGLLLWIANQRSVNHRYDEQDEVPEYRFTALPGHVDPVIVLKAIECYVYQSCESPDYYDSEANALIDALRKHVINMLPGIDDAPGWGINDEDRATLFRSPRLAILNPAVAA